MSFGGAAGVVWWAGEEPKRLYVEREVGWRALGPELGNLGLRLRVLAAVDLDERNRDACWRSRPSEELHFGG